MAKAFHRMTERELLGRTVRLRRQLTTRGGRIFGAGTEMTITRKFAGLELQQTTVCEVCGCGNRSTIARVSFSDCELVATPTDGGEGNNNG